MPVTVANGGAVAAPTDAGTSCVPHAIAVTTTRSVAALKSLRASLRGRRSPQDRRQEVDAKDAIRRDRWQRATSVV
jgi:hypothetical protein